MNGYVVCPQCMGRTWTQVEVDTALLKPDWWTTAIHGVYKPVEQAAMIGFCIDTRCKHSTVEFTDV